MHDIPCLTAFVAFPPFSMLDKCPFSYSRKRVDGEVKMKEMFLLLSPSSLSVGLQSSPFLYILTIFLQMKAHDEVRPLLCLPAQIDRLTVIKFCRDSIDFIAPHLSEVDFVLSTILHPSQYCIVSELIMCREIGFYLTIFEEVFLCLGVFLSLLCLPLSAISFIIYLVDFYP